MKYIQYTYINDELAYEPKERTADEVVNLLAQVCFFKQGGQNYELAADTDKNFSRTAYHIRFSVPEKDGTERRVHQIIRIEQ